jgi:hypothetical protein
LSRLRGGLSKNVFEFFCASRDLNGVFSYFLGHHIEYYSRKGVKNEGFFKDFCYAYLACYKCYEHFFRHLNVYKRQKINKYLITKQNKISYNKEYLRLVGVNPVVIWICWMMRSFVIYLFLSIILTITSTLKLNQKEPNALSSKKALFLNTDAFLIFMTFFIYSIQVTSLSLLAGQIFSKRNIC